MIRFTAKRLFSLFAVALVGLPSAKAALTETPVAPEPDKDQLAFFEKNIRPVLATKCYKCHSAQAEKVKGGLLLDTREGIRDGGDTGHAVVPGNPAESLLLNALHWQDKDMRMPPEKEGGKLPDNVIADFEQWIKMGAPDPRGDPAAVAPKKGIDIEKGKQFWSFQPPKAGPAPEVKDAAWPKCDADRFILSALEAKGLHPAPDADRRTLLRRVSFDLVGLPPSPEEMEAFLNDKSSDAFEKVVDRLLASPQFGERWGRHWLDVARFAESTGKDRNYTFPTAWRYRDYVIAATNADKPYDEFIKEQIAGDLLPAASPAERDQHVIATGFLAIGPKGLNEKNPKQFQMDDIDEQIDATTRSVLGLTVACARCHDHKFDPIPQRDYYALAGIFRSTKTFFGTGGGTGAVKSKNATPLLALSLVDDTPIVSPPPPTKPNPQPTQTLPPRAERRLERMAARDPLKAAQLRAQELAQGAPPAAPKKGGKKAANTWPVNQNECMGVLEDRPSNSAILVRGEITQPAETVPRGFVTVLENTPPPAIPQNESGRLELAQWLTSKDNPLTARVEVNRVWLHLFGQGLVRTADNFGANGEAPSHPELLDALALQFMHDGWSVKHFIRSLVLSHTYQMSSATNADAMEVDPDNHLLWRASPRRLDAEAIRDAMLAASGELELAPPHGSIVASVGEGYVGKGLKPELFSEAKADYRSVYLPIVRDFPPEALDLFDFAEPSLVVAARDVTNVPSQALYLMNNSFVREQAAAMAKRVIGAPLDYPHRIDLAYQLTLGRPPTDAERTRAEGYLLNEGRGLVPLEKGKVEAATLSWSTFCQALFACAEFRYLQ